MLYKITQTDAENLPVLPIVLVNKILGIFSEKLNIMKLTSGSIVILIERSQPAKIIVRMWNQMDIDFFIV